MMNFSSGVVGFFFGILLGFLTTYMIGFYDGESLMLHETIERGHAQYCPKDGKWAWKNECDGN